MSKISRLIRVVNNQINLIEQFIPRNGFPQFRRKLLQKNICIKDPRQENNFVNKEKIPTVWVK